MTRLAWIAAVFVSGAVGAFIGSAAGSHAVRVTLAAMAEDDAPTLPGSISMTTSATVARYQC